MTFNVSLDSLHQSAPQQTAQPVRAVVNSVNELRPSRSQYCKLLVQTRHFNRSAKKKKKNVQSCHTPAEGHVVKKKMCLKKANISHSHRTWWWSESTHRSLSRQVCQYTYAGDVTVHIDTCWI